MKKSKKIALWIAAGSMLLGGLLIFLSLSLLDFDLRKLNTFHVTVQTYPVDESFRNLSILADDCDVKFCITEEGTCRVVCPESEKVTHEVTVENNTLTVKRTDDRTWYEQFGFSWDNVPITVFLTETEYDSLYVQSVSGNISVSDSFIVTDAELLSTSGDISCSATILETLSMESVSGDLNLQHGSSEEALLRTVSGEIEVEDSVAGALTIGSTSGEIDLSHVLVDGHMEIETTSGELTLQNSDAATLKLTSISGNIYAGLQTAKYVTADTTSGDLILPEAMVPDAAAGSCEVTTTSGNIEIRFHENNTSGIQFRWCSVRCVPI